jgi:MFS family permease
MADRVDKRRALVILNMIAGGLALILGVLVWIHMVQVWHVMLIALASGTLVAFEIPIRQTFYVDLVGKDSLANAITLNSSAFNAARVIGPALGGMLIHSVGIDGCFLVNAFSFVFVIIGLGMMALQKFEAVHTPMKVLWIWRGLKYVRRHTTILGICILIGFVSFAAMSYGSLLPIFAKDIFHSDARGYALLYTFNGMGALVASALLAVQRTMRHKGKRLLLGSLLYSFTVAGFAFAPNIGIAYVMLFLTGFFALTTLITANTMVQMLSPDHLRGRIFSIYSMAFLGAAPFKGW